MREKHLLLWKDAGTAMGVLEQLIAHAGACPPSQSRPQRGLRCRTGKNRKYLTILEGPVYSFKSFKSVSKKNCGQKFKRGNFFGSLLSFQSVLCSFVFIICATITNYYLLCLLSYTTRKKVIVCWMHVFESLLYYMVYSHGRGRNPICLSHTNTYTHNKIET